MIFLLLKIKAWIIHLTYSNLKPNEKGDFSGKLLLLSGSFLLEDGPSGLSVDFLSGGSLKIFSKFLGDFCDNNLEHSCIIEGGICSFVKHILT